MFFISKFCFLCLNTFKNLKLLLIEDNKGLVIQKELNYCLPEIVDSSRQIPKYICDKCTSKLKCFYKFKKNCLQSNIYLKSYFQTLTFTDEPYNHLSVKLTDIKYHNKLQVESIDQTLLTEGIELRTTDKKDNRTCLSGTVFKSEIQCTDEIIVKEEFITSEDNADSEFYDNFLNSIKYDSISRDSTSSNEDIIDKDKYSSCENNSAVPEASQDTGNKIKKIKKFQCAICKRKFMHKRILNQHKQIHIKNYECLICKKKFVYESDLIEHKIIHTDAQPSSTCNKSNRTQTVTTNDIFDISPSKRKSCADWNKFECEDEHGEEIEENAYQNHEAGVYDDLLHVKTFCSESSQNSSSIVGLDSNKINCSKENNNDESSTEEHYQTDDSEEEYIPDFETNSNSNPASTVTADEILPRSSFVSDKTNTTDVLLAEKVIPMSATKSYTKKFFCLFCKKVVTRFGRHITTIHKYEPRVLDILRYPMKDTTRKKLIAKLRNEGSLQNNTDKNSSELIVSRRPNPKSKRSAKDFIPCPKCSAYYVSRTFHRHYIRCSRNEEVVAATEPGKSESTGFVISLDLNQMNLHPGVHILLEGLKNDKITKVIINDYLLLHIASFLCHKYFVKKHLHFHSREKLRQLTRLFLTIKSNNPDINEFQDCFKPSNFSKVISEVRKLCSLDLEAKQYTPAIANYLVICLQETCDILQSLCITEQNMEKKQSAIEFKNLLILENSAFIAGETRNTKRSHPPFLLRNQHDISDLI